MPEFYVTFGQKYRHEPHPQGGHPDGWFVVEADDKATAHDLAFQFLNEKWSFLYSKAEFDPTYYPLGELARINARGITHKTSV